MADSTHLNPEPRAMSLLAGLQLANKNIPAAEEQLVELIAWLAFDRPTAIPPAPTEDDIMRILVVDDYPDTAELICQLASLLGHITRPAFTGRDAIKYAHEFQPDLVILDIGLPDIRGDEVARLLFAMPKPPHIVAMSGWTTGGHRERAMEAGCKQFFVKPFNLEMMRKLLEKPEQFWLDQPT